MIDTFNDSIELVPNDYYGLFFENIGTLED